MSNHVARTPLTPDDCEQRRSACCQQVFVTAPGPADTRDSRDRDGDAVQQHQHTADESFNINTCHIHILDAMSPPA
ncbi:hypothetical protein VZT92_001272 [Zoarces viviparus]|uniref:Uncharacterized protein n=1 Tax=Zoarces viviparus TaxID=48416 RepID=A0AAW1G505_ZOAVI